MQTHHEILYQDASVLDSIPAESVDLVITSPPYPMVGMWDEMFIEQNPEIEKALDAGEGRQAFGLMHQILDPVWDEMFRVLKEGRFACINIGDATRKVQDEFCLYSNHARILTYLLNAGFVALPDILWRKQSNAPNKFMGSGMLPAGAYVTLEHEYILILRKGSKRIFKTEEERKNRQESALFWEERNVWYSDIWTDIKGTGQALSNDLSRLRSAAFPFELAYRLINMYSVKGDMVLDPFLGTGTTVAAAMASGRNSLGIEIEEDLSNAVHPALLQILDFSNDLIHNRLLRHIDFVRNRIKASKTLRYTNKQYGFPVVTGQEQQAILNDLVSVTAVGANGYEVCYSEIPQAAFCRNDSLAKIETLLCVAQN